MKKDSMCEGTYKTNLCNKIHRNKASENSKERSMLVEQC